MLHKGTYQASTTSLAGKHEQCSRGMKDFWRIVHVVTGIILVWLPWTGAWENNLALLYWPQIEIVVFNSFFKGAVRGLGIVNILIGIHDVIHARFAHQRHFSPENTEGNL